MTVTVRSAEATRRLGRRLVKKLGGHNVICLYGELGAGKTTLVQGIAKGLGIKTRIISPTFILMRNYKINSKFLPRRQAGQIPNSRFNYLWHVDLYRLADWEEAKALDLAEIWRDRTNLVVIEWAEKIKSLLPKQRVDIKLELVSENERKIRVSKI